MGSVARHASARVPDEAKDVIARLADIMESCGRPFGHRLRDSILAYVASYPFSGNGGPDVRFPLADQIEFRILPKLRGLEIDSHGEAFDDLERLLRDKLADSVFADRLAGLQEQQKKGPACSHGAACHARVSSRG